MVIKKQRVSPIGDKQNIDYKDIDLLKLFITEQGKILPRRVTGLSSKQQKKVTKLIKTARRFTTYVRDDGKMELKFGAGIIPE